MGKNKYIETPEKMWDYFLQYKTHAKENPIERKVSGNKGFVISQERLQRPLTIEGFENWCFDNGIISDLGHYFANTDNKYEEYCTICTRIKKSIRQDQIEGGMVGIYNPSITQRLNNLAENVKQENINVNVLTNDPLSDANYNGTS